jgi:hypothetical protein
MDRMNTDGRDVIKIGGEETLEALGRLGGIGAWRF